MKTKEKTLTFKKILFRKGSPVFQSREENTIFLQRQFNTATNGISAQTRDLSQAF